MVMDLSAYSLFRLVGLITCLVSGAASLATFWFLGMGAENLAEIFPGKVLIAITGPLDADTLRQATEIWFAVSVVGVGCFAWMFRWITHPGRRPSRLLVAALVAQAVLGLFVNRDFLVRRRRRRERRFRATATSRVRGIRTPFTQRLCS
jgi:hypothetical protein